MRILGRDPQAILLDREKEQVDPEEVRQVLEPHGGMVDVVVSRDRIVAVPRDWVDYHISRGTIRR